MSGATGKSFQELSEKRNDASTCEPHVPKKEGAPSSTPNQPVEANLDSGYAWPILLVVFLLNSTACGTSRVYGLVYAKQVAIGYYDHEAASWPIATASTVENLTGILTPALAHYLSWRQIQLLSGLLFIVANLGAYLSSSLLVDILCLGVVQGVASSMNTVLALAVVNDYFDRYRTTAFGISMSGSTFGVLYLVPLGYWTLESYDDFRTVYLLIGCIFSLNIVLAMFVVKRSSLKAPAPDEKRSVKEPLPAERERSAFESRFERQNSFASIDLQCESRRQSVWSSTAGRQPQPALCAAERLVEKHAAAVRAKSSELQMGAEPAHKPSPRLPRAESGSPVANQLSKGAAGKFIVRNESSNSLHDNRRANLEMAVAPSFVVGGEKQSISRTDHGDLARSKSKPPKEKSESEDKDDFSIRSIIALFSVPYLHCSWIMLAIYYLVSRIFLIILIDFGDDHGLQMDQSNKLLNYWSLGEICGRIILSSLIDLQWLSVKSCIVLTCTTLSAFIVLMVLVENYFVYAMCSMLIAALVSLEYVLINVFMIEYLGKSRATSCYSLAALISSFILFGRPTMIGLFRDQLGSYDGLLLLLAAISFVYALLFGLLEPLFVRYWPKRA